jgi:PilZ domain
MQAFMSMTRSQSDRRKKLRKKPLRLVYIELAKGNGGMMRDLSEEGFAVRAMMPVRVGDQTAFSFTLSDTVRIEGEGKVLWVEEGGRVAGVEFAQISPEMKSQIDDWLIEDEEVSTPRKRAKEPAIAPAYTMEELREEIRSTPVRGEEAPVAEELSSAKVEETRIPEPKIPETRVEEISPAKPTLEIAAKQPGAPKVEPKTSFKEPQVTPEAVPEPSAAPVVSVADTLFRKWPKNPPATAAAKLRPANLAPPPSPAAPPPQSHPKHRRLEEEQGEEDTHGQAPPLLPDISEVLIQPHRMSSHADARTLALRGLPEFPKAERAGRENREWFTLRHAVLSMVVLTALVGMIVYHHEVGSGLIWLGETLGGTSSNAGANMPSTNVPAGNTGPVQPSTNSGDATVNSPAGTTSKAQSLSNASKGTPAPVTPLAGITPPSSPEASPDAGQSEYLQAMQLLRGRNSGTDTPEAVRLLWIAIEKGNPSAEVTLADLYWHGQGVVRNCDQTRILLTAAVRKGSSEALKRLQQFQQEGCE